MLSAMGLKKWTIINNISIERLWFGGVWIWKMENGKVVLIKWWLPWSVVDGKVMKNKKDYIECHIVNVVSLDANLVDWTARCPHYLSPYAEQSDLPEHKQWCGWCKWQGISYEKQCQLKEQIVYDAFKIIKDDRFEFFPIIASPEIYGYRNKIEFSFGKYMRKHPRDVVVEEWESPFAVNEQRNAWFHKQGEFSKVVDIEQCYLVSEKMHAVYTRLKHDLAQSWLPVYDVKRHTWVLRHLVLREWSRTGHLMVNISIASNYFQENLEHNEIWESLLAQWADDQTLHETISTLVLTHNNWLWDNVQWPDARLETIWWDGYIYEWLQFEDVELVRFQVSPFSFFQTNTGWAELLFARAKEIVWTVHWNIIDLYCWSWSIWLSFLRQWLGQYVHGIDIVPSAIDDAYNNAKINWLHEQATFHCGKAEKLLKEWVIDDQCFVWKDLIVIDPPRQWIHKDVVAFLGEIKRRHPDHRLLYISCNPVTMARDVKWLMEVWYKLHALQPVDMFPHTHHIETIWLLS